MGRAGAAAIAVPAASLARSQAVARTWREDAGYRALAEAFAHLPTSAECIADRAAALFGEGEWLENLLAPLFAALNDDPWFDPPVRTNRDALRGGAILLEMPVVSVSLSVTSAARLAALPAPATIVCSGRLSVTRYLRAGEAMLRRWTAPPLATPCTADAMGRCTPLANRPLQDGIIVRHDGRRGAQALTGANGDVVALTATVRTGADAVSREYDAASGAFLRMATTDEGAARAQVLLSLLRASRAADPAATAPCFDAATRDGAVFLRWSAMREWLAHDWRTAWPRLADMAAGDPHPEVRATARATLTQLTRQAA